MSRGVNLLVAAPAFLFGARNVWFVVGLSGFLHGSAALLAARRPITSALPKCAHG